MMIAPFDFGKRQVEIVENVIVFVYEHLSTWRDHPERINKKSEKILNSDFPKYLTACARKEEYGFNFFSEEPQEGQHTIDFSVCYDDVNCYNKIITVFECKRLTNEIPDKRKDEYVTGHKKTSGGIQRFKLGVHGKDYKTVGMIGYIQTGSHTEWLEKINNCIDDLCGKPDESGLFWNRNEHLKTVKKDDENRKYYSKSLHPRNKNPNIAIHHLWVDMQEQQ